MHLIVMLRLKGRRCITQTESPKTSFKYINQITASIIKEL